MADTTEQLQAKLAEAEEALHALLTGQSPVSVSHGGSTGRTRDVEFQKADISQLRAYIADLKKKLGISMGRVRARRFYAG